MGDPFKKLTAGAPVTQFSITAWNRMLDMLRWWLSQQSQTGSSLIRGQQDLCIFHVKNNSGQDVPWCGVLGIDGPLYLPTDDEDGFRHKPVLKGGLPTEGTHERKFVIALEPIADGEVGKCAVAGVVPVQLHLEAELTDEFADIADQEFTYLVPAASGAAQILWADTLGSYPGEVWAIVRLAAAGGDEILDGELYDDIEPEGEALVMPRNWHEPTGQLVTDEDVDSRVTVIDVLGNARARGKSSTGNVGAYCTYRYLGKNAQGDDKYGLLTLRRQAQRCKCQTVGTVAKTDATYTVDNVVPMDGGQSPVNSSSDTLTVRNSRVKWNAKDNIWHEIVRDESEGEWAWAAGPCFGDT